MFVLMQPVLSLGYGPPQQSYQGNGGSPAYSQAGPYPGQQQQQQQQGTFWGIPLF